MLRVSLIYGLIAGFVVITIWMLTNGIWFEEMHRAGTAEIFGYAAIIISLTTIFFAVKTYRDKYNAGAISFGKAFLIGLYITLIASVIYSLGWMIYEAAFQPDFMDKMVAAEIAKLQEAGASDAEIAGKREEMQMWMDMYKNPIIEFFMVMLMEMFPVGLLVSLVAAAIMRRKQPKDAVT